jgi:uncharacterized protein (TIGR02217 family)
VLFVDIPFPPRISFGALRRAGWRTGVVAVASGLEATDEKWSHARHAYDISLAVRTTSDYDAVAQHFHSVRGKARAFPFVDPLDNGVDQTRGLLIDVSPGLWQLGKSYGDSDARWERIITRPLLSGIAVYRERASVVTSITSSATVDAATGAVTIAGGVVADGDILSWSGSFRVPCRYDTDELPGMIVNKERRDDGEFWVTCESIPVLEVKELGAFDEASS